MGKCRGKKAKAESGKRTADSGGSLAAFVRPALPADADFAYISPDLRSLAVPLEKIQLDPKNENEHDADSIRAISASYRHFGQRKPIVVNGRTGFISSGNGQFQAAKELGWEYIAIVLTDDDETDHVAFRIADNQTAKFSDFDETLIQEGLALMKDQTPDLFADLELAELEGLTAAPEAKEIEVTTSYALLVKVPSEADQKKWHGKLVKEGLEVEVRTI